MTSHQKQCKPEDNATIFIKCLKEKLSLMNYMRYLAKISLKNEIRLNIFQGEQMQNLPPLDLLHKKREKIFRI